MITQIPYSVFDLPELTALGDKAYQILTERYPGEPLLGGVQEKLSTALKASRLAVGSTQVDQSTAQVRLMDDQRDENYTGFTAYIESGLRRRSLPAWQEACERLMAIVEKNGRGLYKYGYDRQTVSMESLFDDLETPESQTDLATINATEWLAELRADNEAFKQVYSERGRQKALQTIPTNEAARRELKPALENLFTIINACYINGQIEGIDETIDILNEMIARSLASARQSASA